MKMEVGMKSVRLRLAALVAVTLASFNVYSVNLLTGGDFETENRGCGIRISRESEMVRLSRCKENLTWNNCLKVQIVKVFDYGDDKRRMNADIDIGGDDRTFGVAVRGGEKYKFGFDAAGTIPKGIVMMKTVDEQGRENCLETELGSVSFSKEWTAYEGVFAVPENVVRIALVIRFWADTKQWKMPFDYEVGQELLLDNFRIEAVSSGREIWPVRAVVLSEKDGEKLSLGDFFAFSSSRRPAKHDTRLVIQAGVDTLVFGVDCAGARVTSVPGKVWGGDVVELFVAGVDPKKPPFHFAVSPDGRRWMAEDNPDYDCWSSSAKIIAGDRWRAAFTVPWKTLGYERRPASGTPIRFNVTRNVADEKDPCHRAASFSFVGTEFLNPERLGVLYVGAPKGLDGDASRFWYKSEQDRESKRLARLGREKLLVAQLPVCFDPSVPFLPNELLVPAQTIRARGARNERVSIPIAIANMTDSFEEFCVQLVCGYEAGDLYDDYPHLAVGLKSDAGIRLQFDKITLRRGVRFRDSDVKDRSAHFDMLTRLENMGAVPVPARDSGLLWIEVDCSDVRPGTYKGELIVTPLTRGTFGRLDYGEVSGVKNCPVVTDDSKRMAVELEVLPFAIDIADFGFHACCQPSSTVDIEFFNRMGGVGSILNTWWFDCRFDTEGGLIKESVNDKGVRDAVLSLVRDRQRRLHSLPRISVMYSAYCVFKSVYAKKSNLKPGTDSFWRGYGEFCRLVATIMSDAGFALDDWMLQPIDEPDTKRFSRDEVVKAFRLAKEAVPQMRLMVTYGEFEFFEDIWQSVDCWIFGGDAFDDSKCVEYARRMRENGKEVSMYLCQTRTRLDLHRYYRRLSWMAASWGARFVTLYHLFDKPCELSMRRTTEGGITYQTVDGLIPSVRYMSMEAGLNDIRYLKTLERLAEACPDAELSLKAKRLIADSYKNVTRTFAHDPKATERFRDECIRLILAMIKTENR